MTVGKDVSALFPDVVNCMQTDNLELKKLVYLYLMNYAKSQPDMAIMAVNTFVKVLKIVTTFNCFHCLKNIPIKNISTKRIVKTQTLFSELWLFVPWVALE